MRTVTRASASRTRHVPDENEVEVDDVACVVDDAEGVRVVGGEEGVVEGDGDVVRPVGEGEGVGGATQFPVAPSVAVQDEVGGSPDGGRVATPDRPVGGV